MAADDLHAHAICTVAQATNWVKDVDTDSTGDDIIVQRIINAVTDRIEAYLRRRVIIRSDWVTEVFDGDNAREHFVNHPPIADVDEVDIEDAITLDSTDCDDVDQVRFDSATGENSERGRVWLHDYVFSGGYADNCSVKYKGGWNKKDSGTDPEIPRDIFLACLIEVKRIYKMKDRQDSNIASKSLGVTGESISYITDSDLSKEVTLKLDEYVRRIPAG